MHVSINPELIHLNLFGGISVPETLLSAFAASMILILISILIRIFVVPRMKENPKGFQNVVELMVEAIQSFSTSTSGSWVGNSVSPYIFTIVAFIVVSGLMELVGIRANTSDLNSTITLAFITFILIRVYAIRKNGPMAPLRQIIRPTPIVAPIMFLTELALPISMACRLFGNIMGGMIIMEMVYSIALARWVLPAFLSVFFTLFHTGMQAYIFSTLTLIFIHEAVEETKPKIRRSPPKPNPG